MAEAAAVQEFEPDQLLAYRVPMIWQRWCIAGGVACVSAVLAGGCNCARSDEVQSLCKLTGALVHVIGIQMLGDELGPEVAAAAGLPASAVTFVHAKGLLTFTAELPWIEGERAKALLARMLGAARAIVPVVPASGTSVHLRVGPLELAVRASKGGDGGPYVELVGQGVIMTDPDAVPLVLHDPERANYCINAAMTFWGTLENTGKTPTPPIEAFMVSLAEGSVPPTEFTKQIGIIAPGKSVSYELSGNRIHRKVRAPEFRAGGKPIAVFNESSWNHAVDWLDTAIDIRAEQGVWCEHDGDRHGMKVRLTAEQVALPEGARNELMRTIAKALQRHGTKYHGDYLFDGYAKFAAPGGGGWQLSANGKEIARYEGE
jgi:hypothetical protein